MTDLVLSSVEYGDPRGRPLVALHGGWSAKEIWGQFSTGGGLDRRRWICLDHRGHGQSPQVPPYEVVQMAQDVVATLDTLGIEHFDLIGHSLGGQVAPEVAKRLPSQVGSVALLDPPAMTPDERLAFRARIRAPQTRIATGEFDSIDELVATLWGAPSQSARAHIERDVQCMVQRTGSGRYKMRADPRLLDAAHSPPYIGDVPPSFGAFNGRVLVLSGALFDAVTERGLEIMQSELGHRLTSVTVDGAHWLFWDSREEVADHVARFLDGEDHQLGQSDL